MTRNQATVITVVIAAVLVAAFLWMVASYWSFNRIGTGAANSFALLVVVLPVALLVSAIVALSLQILVHRRTQKWSVSTVATIAGLISSFVLLFMLEVRRTAAYPTEQRRTLTEFVDHIFGGVHNRYR